jgi:hypothetical protein
MVCCTQLDVRRQVLTQTQAQKKKRALATPTLGLSLSSRATTT